MNDGTEIRLSSIAFSVRVLGPGQRVVVWTQGCSIGCGGCASQDTWDPLAGKSLKVDDVVQQLLSHLEKDECSGVTISGGEPLEQAGALELFSARLRPHMREDQDILVFSGMPARSLQRDFSEVLARIDALIAGPYQQHNPTELLWRASANQRLMTTSDLGALKYRPYMDVVDSEPTLEIIESDGVVSVVGLPRPGDLERLSDRLNASGVLAKESSWRLSTNDE